MAARAPGTQRPAGGPPRDRRDGGAIERTEHDFDRGAALEQAGAHERERLGERVIAGPDDHEQALTGGAAREVVHERHRCLVGGVQVVDHEHDPAVRGGLRQQLGDRREDTVAIHGLLPRPRRGPHRRQQPRQGALCAVGQRAGQLRAPRGEGIERLHERRVRRAALLLVGGAAQRVKAELLRLGEHSLDEARLADPQRARDEQRAAIARRGTLQRAERRGELSLTPFDGSVQEPSRADRRAAGELALQRQRLLGRLRADPRELVAQQAELAGGG